jgi:hypothetical protein
MIGKEINLIDDMIFKDFAVLEDDLLLLVGHNAAVTYCLSTGVYTVLIDDIYVTSLARLSKSIFLVACRE